MEESRVRFRRVDCCWVVFDGVWGCVWVGSVGVGGGAAVGVRVFVLVVVACVFVRLGLCSPVFCFGWDYFRLGVFAMFCFTWPQPERYIFVV